MHRVTHQVYVYILLSLIKYSSGVCLILLGQLAWHDGNMQRLTNQSQQNVVVGELSDPVHASN